jgi:hypothetical protein
MAEFEDTAEALEAVRQDFAAHPMAAAQCTLGEDLKLIRPEGASPQSPSFYVLGFNGGGVRLTKKGRNKPADRYDRVCESAAKAVGVKTWVLAERCLWGSPHAGQIEEWAGGKMAMRDLLRLHARANRALFRELPPLLVWAPGVSTYVNEAVEDYGLRAVAFLDVQKHTRREHLWRHFVSAEGVPFLFTKHPASRPSKDECKIICAKLAELAHLARGQNVHGDV